MPDIKKIIDNPDTPGSLRSDRELDLEDWDETQAQNTAVQEGIELTEEHWEVVRYLREYYLVRQLEYIPFYALLIWAAFPYFLTHLNWW